MDRYIFILGKDVPVKKLKFIAMTALLLALKIDDGIMSRRVCHEYINKMEYLLTGSPKMENRGRSTNKKEMGVGSGYSSR